MSIKNDPYEDIRGNKTLELELIEIAYCYTQGDRDMAYEIAEAIYLYLEKLDPHIDKWFRARA